MEISEIGSDIKEIKYTLNDVKIDVEKIKLTLNGNGHEGLIKKVEYCQRNIIEFNGIKKFFMYAMGSGWLLTLIFFFLKK